MGLMPSLNRDLMDLAHRAVNALEKIADALTEPASGPEPAPVVDWPVHAPVPVIDQREGWQR